MSILQTFRFMVSHQLSEYQISNIQRTRPRLAEATLNPALWIR